MRYLLWTFILFTSTSFAVEKFSPTVNEIEVESKFKQSSEKKYKQKKEQTWWEKRNTRPDIYYPHNVHMAVMKKGGDSCFLCHPFNRNTITDLNQLKKINIIANEPLEAICHDCHVVNLTAPWRCDLCHHNPRDIWPADHNLNYLSHHGEDARLNENECRQCHINIAFCTDCHFRRDPLQRRAHGLGYRATHGIEAQINAAYCSRCHNARYCSDCHRKRQ